jgi:hypothetical protein
VLPSFERGRIEFVEVQAGQIEAAFLHIRVMALDAVPFEKGSDRDGGEG